VQKYIFRKYDSRSPTLFKLESNRLKKILGPGAKIQHIGSTAIPGLGGKGILDIAVGVGKSGVLLAKTKLVKAGFEYREIASTKVRLFFRKDYVDARIMRRVHLHLVIFDSQDWNDMVKFRDFLLNNTKEAIRYANIKEEGVKKAKGLGKIYRNFKEKFIVDALMRVNR
jgi:GrpB-like predicted nucleotidyltransferase (UPF0157 family)